MSSSFVTFDAYGRLPGKTAPDYGDDDANAAGKALVEASFRKPKGSCGLTVLVLASSGNSDAVQIYYKGATKKSRKAKYWTIWQAKTGVKKWYVKSFANVVEVHKRDGLFTAAFVQEHGLGPENISNDRRPDFLAEGAWLEGKALFIFILLYMLRFIGPVPPSCAHCCMPFGGCPGVVPNGSVVQSMRCMQIDRRLSLADSPSMMNP